ncbi:MAG TPA: DbpA RNA binding domain-containing protein [Gemmatimonadales bacterium]|nr:DbpA RNA binding domain-containing protein [Gemmatimonadales bacterium]
MTIEARVRHVVLVTPPAVERAGKAWELMDPRTVIVCADHEQAVLWADAAPVELRAHAVTGLTRTAALLKEGRVGVLAGSPADLSALVARSALKLDTLETLVIAWPESFSAELDTLLGEAPEARRVILSWDPHGLTDFIERHARRAEVIGDIPLDSAGKPLGPVASARYAVVPAARRAVTVRDVLDAVRSVRPYVWKGGDVAAPTETPDAIIATTLPTREELRLLAAIAQPLVIALASQVPYLKSIAALSALALPSRADRAQDRNAAVRTAISARLTQGDVDAELAVLAPLFEEHDPALVAGALLALQREAGSGKREAAPEAAPAASGWVKLFVTVGTKDRAGAKDLVGALIKEAGLQKGQIGRIEVRETFSLVDVAPAVMDQAVQRLSGVTIRGRRVTARPDRG